MPIPGAPDSTASGGRAGGAAGAGDDSEGDSSASPGDSAAPGVPPSDSIGAVEWLERG
jgi:hypothetical protein